MEGYLKKEEMGCPKLLDLMIPVSRDGFVMKRTEAEDENNRRHSHEEKKLELRLGPPGEDWTISKDKSDLLSSFAYFSNNPCGQNPWQQLPVMKDSSQPGSNSRVLPMELKQSDKKAFSTAPANTASTAHKRSAPGPVVGWPPVRSFRKNITSGNCSKFVSESPNVVPDNVSGQKPVENSTKSLFVKINMDGIPIGRKVDLKTCDSYDKLSLAVDNLFRGLLAAQVDCNSGGMEDKEEGGKSIGGLLDGSGEYTLVYEDNEGDRMLVGDVPWHMFISTVKRLRVLKSSELTLSRGSKQGKLS